MTFSSEQQAANEHTPPEQLWLLAQENISLARIVARNFNASPNLLQKLANYADYDTLLGVILNPNTPVDALFKVGRISPELVFENPIFPLLLLENPDLAAQIPVITLTNLLQCESIPVGMLEQVEQKFNTNDATRDQQKLLTSIILNPKTPKSLLQKILGGSWGCSIISSVIDCRDLPANTLEELVGHKELEIRRKIAWHPNTPGIALEKLFFEDDQFIRQGIARHPNSSAHVLEEVSEGGLLFQIDLAANPSTPVNLIAVLVTVRNRQVQNCLIKHPNLPAWVMLLFEKLSENQTVDYILQYSYVLQHPDIPVKLLELLSSHDTAVARYSVALNPNTPLPILEKLANESTPLANHVARNPSVPIALLEKLARNPEVWNNIARHPNVTSELLDTFKDSGELWVRKALSENPKTSSSTLDLLKDDRTYEIIEKIVRHPNISASALMDIAQRYKLLFKKAARHPNAPVELKVQLRQQQSVSSFGDWNQQDRS